MIEGTLVAGRTRTVTAAVAAHNVTVTTDGDDIWFTTDGTAPKAGFAARNARATVRRPGVAIVAVYAPLLTVVRLVSAGSPRYTVTFDPPVPAPPGPAPPFVIDEVLFRAEDGEIRRVTLDEDGALITEPIDEES